MGIIILFNLIQYQCVKYLPVDVERKASEGRSPEKINNDDSCRGCIGLNCHGIPPRCMKCPDCTGTRTNMHFKSRACTPDGGPCTGVSPGGCCSGKCGSKCVVKGIK